MGESSYISHFKLQIGDAHYTILLRRRWTPEMIGRIAKWIHRGKMKGIIWEVVKIEKGGTGDGN